MFTEDTYLSIDIRKPTRTNTRMKMSTILHLPRKSSQSKVEPRLDTETIDGGTNHKPRMINCFVYGHAKDSKNMIIAIPRPPAAWTHAG